MKADGKSETLAIPLKMREEVDHRDNGYCRFCGRMLLERRALHHIFYGGATGGRRHHHPNNLISLCYLPGDSNCHLRVHSNKGRYQPILAELVEDKHPNHVTALQLMRWKGLMP